MDVFLIPTCIQHILHYLKKWKIADDNVKEVEQGNVLNSKKIKLQE